MDWKAATQFLHALAGQKNVERLARTIGARYIPSITRVTRPAAISQPEQSRWESAQQDEIAALNEESDRLGVDIPWGQPPFEKALHRAVFNYVGIERSYGAVSAYQCEFVPVEGEGDFLAQAQFPFAAETAFIYDVVIPGQPADPEMVEPGEEEEEEVAADPAVRTPDADADIRFLEDRAASLCEEPEVLDLKGHHVVVLRDIGMADRQNFYEGLIPIAQDALRDAQQ